MVVPGTGISLQNRGFGLSLRLGYSNLVAPRKHPAHTLISGFVTHKDQLLMSFGGMGGSMQAHSPVQGD